MAARAARGWIAYKRNVVRPIRHSEFVISFVFREVFRLKLRHANGLVKTRPDRFAFDAVARGLHRPGNFLAGEERVDAARGFLAFRHGVDDFSPAVGTIAAGKNFG